MFKLRVNSILIGFFVCIIVAFPIRAEDEDEVLFLHHFEELEPDFALGDPVPVEATAKIVDDGWNFHGNSPGSGLEVVAGVRLDFNVEGNIDWNLGTLELWLMPYVDLADGTNHKIFCSPIGHDDPKAIHLWKTGCCDDLRIRHRDDINNMTEAVWPGAADWEEKDWHHITVTWDNEVGLNLYADGELVASSNASWESDEPYPTFSIGGQGGAATTNGIIDELVIYNYVLSEEDVMERFQATNPLKDSSAVEASGKLTTTWGKLKD